MKTINIKEFKQLFTDNLWKAELINNLRLHNVYCIDNDSYLDLFLWNGEEFNKLCSVEFINNIIEKWHIDFSYDDGKLYFVTLFDKNTEIKLQLSYNELLHKRLKEHVELPF